MMAVRWACWLLVIATPISALRTVHGSPCTDVCGTTTNTTSDEMACLDADFNTTIGTTVGKNFKSCVSCLLASPYQNTTIGETDVNWGLCMSLTMPAIYAIWYPNNFELILLDSQPTICVLFVCI